MSRQLKIYFLPEGVLYQKALPVEVVDDKVRSFLDDMVVTMYRSGGVGLAANQVGIAIRCIVVDTDQTHARGEVRAPDSLQHEGKPICLVNPIIIEKSEEMFDAEEGCLSCPGISVVARRHVWIKVRYIDYNGTEQEIKANGLFGQCIQHEIDHLNGKTLPDFADTLLRKNALLDKVKRTAQKLQESSKSTDIVDARVIYRDFL
jgi:peptide deformylase